MTHHSQELPVTSEPTLELIIDDQAQPARLFEVAPADIVALFPSGAAAVSAAAEISREPLKIVTCNLNDHTTTEGVEAIVDHFIEKASQGNVTVRIDLERMIAHLRRSNLPHNSRSGFKPIQGARVRFGEDDKLWDFYELKPLEAAGLSLRTDVAKNSRIYFIRMDDGSVGVIGIEPRATQEQFLAGIRIKTRRRG